MAPITRPAKTSLRGMPASSGDGPAPRVSVVIPTHNRADLVGRAISSVLNQTFRDFELIVVDDGSKDSTQGVVAANLDPRPRLVLRAKAGGPSAARNTGIAVARGEWVAFLDDDDEWLPEKLELQLARLGQVPQASAVYCLRALQTAEGVVPLHYNLPLPEGDMTHSVLTAGHILSPCALVVRRSALLEVGGFDETFRTGENRDLGLRLTQAGHWFAAVPETLVIVHAEHKRRLTQNAASLSRGFAQYERRWRRLARHRLTPDDYAGIGDRNRQELESLHVRQIKRLVRKGDRKKAWSYVRAMTSTLHTYPWAGPYVSRAFAVVVFGRFAERIVSLPERGAESKTRKALQAESGVD